MMVRISPAVMEKQTRKFTPVLKTALGVMVVMLLVSTLHRLTDRVADDPQPAGFWHGVAHGALMPLAMPGLALGHDVEIYATNNTGRTYKLGYTVGLSGCDALFFGVCFRRWSRWKNKRHETGK